MSLDMQLHYTDNMASLSVQHVHQCLQELVENGVGLSEVRCRMLVGWNLALPQSQFLAILNGISGFKNSNPDAACMQISPYFTSTSSIVLDRGNAPCNVCLSSSSATWVLSFLSFGLNTSMNSMNSDVWTPSESRTPDETLRLGLPTSS